MTKSLTADSVKLGAHPQHTLHGALGILVGTTHPLLNVIPPAARYFALPFGPLGPITQMQPLKLPCLSLQFRATTNNINKFLTGHSDVWRVTQHLGQDRLIKQLQHLGVFFVDLQTTLHVLKDHFRRPTPALLPTLLKLREGRYHPALQANWIVDTDTPNPTHCGKCFPWL